MIETIDSVKLADKVDKAWAGTNSNSPLNVLVQVNTSAEDRKFNCNHDNYGHFQGSLL